MKISTGTKPLPSSWTTRSELASTVLNDPDLNDFAARHGTFGPHLVPEEAVNLLFLGTSWRLTETGLSVMLNLYEAMIHSNQANNVITPRIIIGMSRIVAGPWSINRGAVIIWDKKLHFELTMVDGDIHRFIEFKHGS